MLKGLSMDPLFYAINGYLFAMTVIRARDSLPARWYGIGTWLAGTIFLVWRGREFDLDFFLSSAGFAGLTFLGWKFGRWLGAQDKR
jgi:uncharacterized membrane protein